MSSFKRIHSSGIMRPPLPGEGMIRRALYGTFRRGILGLIMSNSTIKSGESQRIWKRPGTKFLLKINWFFCDNFLDRRGKSDIIRK